ncbi:MAG: glycine cleavage system protein GcvH [Planctomycetota bacterium]|jgi:glycine cleavage system H protein
MTRPANARYTESHEWAVLEGDVLTLGVTDFAIEHLGDIVYVDLTEAGIDVAKGDTTCEIESVKAVAEVYAPVAGTILEVNGGLADDPGPMSADCYGAGWLVKIKVADVSGFEELMDRAAYEKHLETAEPV